MHVSHSNREMEKNKTEVEQPNMMEIQKVVPNSTGFANSKTTAVSKSIPHQVKISKDLSVEQMPNPLEFHAASYHQKRGFVESAPKQASVPIMSELSSVRHSSPQQVARARDASLDALPTLNTQTAT